MLLENLHYEFYCKHRINLYQKLPKPLCLPSHFKSTSCFQLELLKKLQAAMEPIPAKTVLMYSSILATLPSFLDTVLSPLLSFLELDTFQRRYSFPHKTLCGHVCAEVLILV